MIHSGSALVVGEAGVGKSTLIAAVAREMDVERRLERKKSKDSSDNSHHPPMFWQSSGGRLIAGMRYLGQWQQRLEEVVAELGDINGVLVVENLLDLVSVGGSEPRNSLAAFLLPYVRSGSLAHGLRSYANRTGCLPKIATIRDRRVACGRCRAHAARTRGRTVEGHAG